MRVANSAEPPITVLLVEDNPGDIVLVQEVLHELPGQPFVFESVSHLAAGLERLKAGGIGVVLLDLNLPDATGLDTLLTACHHAPDVPIVVLTGLDDEAVGLEAMHHGAQDYLVKGTLTAESLARSLRYAIGRHQTLRQLRMMSTVDELTGLNNRRGFLTLAERFLKLADRNGNEMVLAFADLDDLKRINDTWGHDEGDHALIETARLLRSTFRESDIIARFGGDEFAVLMLDCPSHKAEALVARLKEKLSLRNAELGRRYTLSISVGLAAYNPAEPCSVEALLRKADAAMYEQKRVRTEPAFLK
ncbi:MAG: diguanylate cyclase [Candidatus Zipacnadales bacterium]